MNRPHRRLIATLVLICVSFAAVDDALAKRSWGGEKCFRYQRDWSEALRRYGQSGFSPEFLDGVAAFIGSRCQSLAKICPRTAKDRELVDVLAIRVVNEGMSTTFLPFDCPPSP